MGINWSMQRSVNWLPSFENRVVTPRIVDVEIVTETGIDLSRLETGHVIAANVCFGDAMQFESHETSGTG